MPVPTGAHTRATRRAAGVLLGWRECWRRLPRFLDFQLEGACVQQRLLERQELLVPWCNIASAEPARTLGLATPGACRLRLGSGNVA